MKGTVLPALLTGLALLLVPGSGDGQKAKVFRSMPTEHIEKILKDMNIAFQKSPAKEEGVMFYDYERNQFKLRLHNYSGKDLWLEGIFPRAPLETVNRWNQRTKFSRAVLIKEDDGDSTSLEAQLDCTGGVTEGMVRQFIRRFDGEVQAFAKFLKK